MPDLNAITPAQVANYLMLVVFWGAAIWVFFDTRKRGRPFQESLVWGLFMGMMFPLAILVYILFRRKKLL